MDVARSVGAADAPQGVHASGQPPPAIRAGLAIQRSSELRISCDAMRLRFEPHASDKNHGLLGARRLEWFSKIPASLAPVSDSFSRQSPPVIRGRRAAVAITAVQFARHVLRIHRGPAPPAEFSGNRGHKRWGWFRDSGAVARRVQLRPLRHRAAWSANGFSVCRLSVATSMPAHEPDRPRLFNLNSIRFISTVCS